MAEQNAENLALWKRHETTPPEHTKEVAARGGFTSICAQYQKMMGTSEWGPYGASWGLRALAFEIIYEDAAPIAVHGSGEFFYEFDDPAEPNQPRRQYSFEIHSDIGWRVGDDVYKKLQTDMLSKALSYLGFSADVFLGMYEDGKYVEGLRRGNGSQPPQQPQRREGPPASHAARRSEERSDPPPDGAPYEKVADGISEGKAGRLVAICVGRGKEIGEHGYAVLRHVLKEARIPSWPDEMNQSAGVKQYLTEVITWRGRGYDNLCTAAENVQTIGQGDLPMDSQANDDIPF